MEDMYVVIETFIDLEDDLKTKYILGNIYPREGLEVSEERLRELSSSANKRKKPLIMLLSKIPVEVPPMEVKELKVVKEEEPVEEKEAVEEKPKKTTRKKVVKEDVKED